MKVCDIMTRDRTACRPDNNLAEVAALMWQHSCGALPILDECLRVIGVITDRDICLALGTRDKRAADVTVNHVMSGQVFVCDQDSDIHVALRSMAEHSVRRLPVVNRNDELMGIISIDDIAVHAQWAEPHKVELSFLDVIRTLRPLVYPAITRAKAAA
jgi:CBS domain-containing protein